MPTQQSSEAKPADEALPPWLLDLSATPIFMFKTSTTTMTTVPLTTTKRPMMMMVHLTVPNLIHQKATMTEAPSHNKVIKLNNTMIYEVVTEFKPQYGKDIKLMKAILDHCPPQTVRNLFWNWMKEDDEAIIMCPHGTVGFARWLCSPDAQ